MITLNETQADRIRNIISDQVLSLIAQRNDVMKACVDVDINDAIRDKFNAKIEECKAVFPFLNKK